MNDAFIMFLTDKFFELEKSGKDGFILIKLSVPMKVLYELYERLILVDVPMIETIENDKKEIYWNIAKRYYTDQEQAIKASKASYMLGLICNY